MSGVEVRQRAASEGHRGGRRGQEGRPAPLYRASWSTEMPPLIQSVVSNDSVSGQRRPRSACADVQVYLGLRSTHLTGDQEVDTC